MATLLEINLLNKYEGAIPSLKDSYLLAGQYIYLTKRKLDLESVETIKNTKSTRRFLDFLLEAFEITDCFEVSEEYLESIQLLLLERNGMIVFQKKSKENDCLLYFPKKINSLQKRLRGKNLL
ncbi:MAG: hypothetical protein COB02_10015 [Candidatus Cloacimonadota bacterium]|nr:MAG: hypothetical protein COB02_10015 [Candidatus Cloacimonadota bacterium]